MLFITYCILYVATGSTWKYTPGMVVGGALAGFVRGVARSIQFSFEFVRDTSVSLYRGVQGLSLKPVTGSGIHGTSTFLDKNKQRELLSPPPRHKGLLIDGKSLALTEKNTFNHSLIAAPSGMGKTSILIINNILHLNSSLFISDPSGELYEKTSQALVDKGFDVQVIDFGNVYASHHYNPFLRASASETDLKKFIHMLVEAANPGSSGDSKFWESGAAEILFILAKCLMNTPPEYRNLPNLRHLLINIGSDGDGIKSFVIDKANDTTFSEFKSFISTAERTRQGFIATAKSVLGVFSEPDLCFLTSRDTLNLSLRKQKTALYLIIPEQNAKFFGFIATCLYSQLFSYLMKESEGKSVVCLMDEFANVPPVPSMSQIITTIRKRRVGLVLVLQDLSQLKQCYGDREAQTIISNCANRVFFPGLSIATCKELSATLGRTTIVQERKDGSTVEVGRSLLTPDEIRTSKDILFLSGNNKAVRISATPYYKQRRLRKLTSLPPAPRPTSDHKEVPYLKLN